MDLGFVEKKILKLEEELRLLKAVQQLISAASHATSEGMELVEKDGKIVAVITRRGDTTTVELLEPLDESSYLVGYFYGKFLKTDYMRDVVAELLSEDGKVTGIRMKGDEKKLQTALRVARWCLQRDF
jgi:hypothetical protein